MRIDKKLKAELRRLLDGVIDDALRYQHLLLINTYGTLELFAEDFRSIM